MEMLGEKCVTEDSDVYIRGLAAISIYASQCINSMATDTWNNDMDLWYAGLHVSWHG